MQLLMRNGGIKCHFSSASGDNNTPGITCLFILVKLFSCFCLYFYSKGYVGVLDKNLRKSKFKDDIICEPSSKEK